MNCFICGIEFVFRRASTPMWIRCKNCGIEGLICASCYRPGYALNPYTCQSCKAISKKSAELIIRGLAYAHINEDDPDNLIRKIVEQLMSTDGDFRHADLDFARVVEDLRFGRPSERTKLRRIKGK